MLTRYIRFSIYIFSTLFIAGCGKDIGDLETYKEEVLARPGGRLEPIPEIKPYEAYAYKSAVAEARDPFRLFYQKVQADFEEMDQNAGLTAEMEKEIRTRNREELEAFELDSLRMVGTLEDANENWGIVLDPDRTIHRVKVGNYLGKNIGKVLNVFEDRIELREIIRNSAGRWEERQAALAIAE